MENRSPTTSIKLRNRNSANKLRHSSPKLQEVLRERCRQRMREKRGQLFNKRRFGMESNSRDVQDTLTEIVRKEFNNLVTRDLDPAFFDNTSFLNELLDQEEELENEILSEEEQWILQEYEKMTQEEIEILALTADEQDKEVICPICQRSNLTQKENNVTCISCDFSLNNCINVKEIGYRINSCVNNHSVQCRKIPSFFPLSENNKMSLYLVCDECSTWASII